MVARVRIAPRGETIRESLKPRFLRRPGSKRHRLSLSAASLTFDEIPVHRAAISTLSTPPLSS